MISIHAPRTGSDSAACRNNVIRYISIHAPRTGSDEGGTSDAAGAQGISIHAPRTGSDRTQSEALAAREEFQSTLPARGAT